MLSSRRAVRSQSLHGSSSRIVASGPSATGVHPPPFSAYPLSFHRDFSWGAKHKIGHKNAGKVFKGFSTHDHTRARKQLYRGTFWNHHYFPYIRRYLPISEWRFSSSWGKPSSVWTKSEQTTASKTKADEKAEEDWYSRYQLQKKKQYDDFMKKMEEDPIGMLFGSRWAKWVDGAEAKLSRGSSLDAQGGNSNLRCEKTIWGWGYGPPASSPKPSNQKDANSMSTNSGIKTAEGGVQEYEIDPITNRKVPKKATTPKRAVKPEGPSTKRSSPTKVSGASGSVQDTQQSTEIPVKRFVPPQTKSSTPASTNREESLDNAEENSSPPKVRDSSTWLSQEGFGQKQEHIPDNKPMLETKGEKPNRTGLKIESALDRHLQTKSATAKDPDRAALEYKPREITTEDIDLLRSSDVRASSGLRGRPAKESDSEKEARQRRLEKEYDARPLHRDRQLAQEVAKERREEPALIGQRNPAEPTSSSKTSVTGTGRHDKSIGSPTEWVNEISEPLATQGSPKDSKPVVQAVVSERTNKIKAQIVPLKARLDAMKADYDALRRQWLDEKRRQEERTAKKIKDMHEAEVRAQKVAMEAVETRADKRTHEDKIAAGQVAGGDAVNKSTRRLQSYLPGEGDMASNVHEFASRDRWYKKKAPHASDGMDAKFERLANDRALIREVRDIYEETYGTIDTAHRQPALGEKVEKSPQSPKGADSSDSAIPQSPSVDDAAQDRVSASVSYNTANLDPLAIIQRLFHALRQAQSLVQDHRSALQQIPNPSEAQLISISESINTLAIIQKLFSELRQAQAVTQDHRTGSKQLADPKNPAMMLQTSEPYDKTVKSILGFASKLAADAKVHSGDLTSPHPTSPKSTRAEDKDTKSLNVYRILAFDPAKQRVIASKATSLAPFSKEQPLLPVEALEVLKNPGKFLPELMNLHNKGYTVVSGTSNILVFKKSATEQEVEEAKREEIMKDVNPVDLMGTEHYLFGTSSPILTYEEIKAAREKQQKADQDLAQKTSAPSTASTSSSAEAASAESTTEESAPKSESPETDSPAVESNLPPSDKVRREEAVFSGPSRGNWQEAESKRSTKKYKRAAKRSKRFKHMFVTGTVTAACCYAVGVISQMMQH